MTVLFCAKLQILVSVLLVAQFCKGGHMEIPLDYMDTRQAEAEKYPPRPDIIKAALHKHVNEDQMEELVISYNAGLAP